MFAFIYWNYEKKLHIDRFNVLSQIMCKQHPYFLYVCLPVRSFTELGTNWVYFNNSFIINFRTMNEYVVLIKGHFCWEVAYAATTLNNITIIGCYLESFPILLKFNPLKFSLPTNSKIALYKSLILPILDNIYMVCNEYGLHNQLQKLINDAIWFI